MRYTSLAALVILAAAQSTDAAPVAPKKLEAIGGSLESRYDRFEGTMVHESRYRGGDTFEFQVGLVYAATPDGKATGPASAAIYLFFAQRDEWRYLKCNDVAWLLDGRPFKVRAASEEHDGDVHRDGTVGEQKVLVGLPRATIAALGSAREIEFRICNDEYKLTDLDLVELSELAALVRPLKLSGE